MKTFTFLFAIFCATLAQAQSPTTGVISGKIVDKNTQEVLIGAAVQIEGTNVGVTSDVEGVFKLTVPSGQRNREGEHCGLFVIDQIQRRSNFGQRQHAHF